MKNGIPAGKSLASKVIDSLCPADIVNLAFLIILSAIDIFSHVKIFCWYQLVIGNLIFLIVIMYVVYRYESKTDEEKSAMEGKFSISRILRFWYAVPLIIFFFKEVYLIINLINAPTYDTTLIYFDRWIFGVDPTQWIYRFENPFLTEILQIIYFLYYIVIVIYGLELYLWRRYDEFKYAIFIIFLGFYLCYLLYMVFPAVGPRFYLHDFKAINTELPGVFITKWIRQFLDFAESIPANVRNPQDYVQRDAMPSAHIVIAILLVYLSKKIKSRSFYFYLPYCILMIISTIYLRYHYVVDIIAGGIIAVITIWTVKLLMPKRREITE
jgi:membrane-associated phospholipid phosphatase